VRPSNPPTAPEIRCQQPATPAIGQACAADDWIEDAGGAARLSECAVGFITEVLGTLAKERKLRKIEHACLDEHEKRGTIRQ
jgi:hypothetical protein